jgi:beta-RFAP synthase
MIRVEAPARLHFGLLSVPIAGAANSPSRQYGGVGLMIDSPRVIVHAEPAREWLASGPNSSRALAFAQAFVTTLPTESICAFKIDIQQCPEPHAGLGSGTALAMAVARAMACALGHDSWPAAELAKRVGRGLRSAVGVHGFEHGGLIVEAGKKPGECLAPLVGHYDFPSAWRVVLARPQAESSWHGPRESQAFSRLTRNNPTDQLCRIVLTGMLPALAAEDLNAFGEALYEFNAHAGEAFAGEQGGAYASPAVAGLVTLLRKQGIRGVGQSSWGPTVFAIVEDEERALWISDLLRNQAEIPVHEPVITRASRHGALVQ